MKTIIAGMRDYHNYSVLKFAMNQLDFMPTEIVSGAASGVDSLGERWAKENGIPIKRFHADWDEHGKAAGPIRNRKMASYAHALVAIWDGKSRGTSNMIEEARRRNLTVVVHGVNGYTPTRI